MKIKIIAIILILSSSFALAYLTAPKKSYKLNPPQINPEETYRVVNILDGDTLEVRIDKSLWKIRMMGIDTPETIDPDKPVQCFGLEASNLTKKLLRNTEVKIIFDSKQEKIDKFNRLLAYVYIEDIFVNKYLLENGYAREYTYGGVYDFQKEFREVEERAIKEKKGLWLSCF